MASKCTKKHKLIVAPARYVLFLTIDSTGKDRGKLDAWLTKQVGRKPYHRSTKSIRFAFATKAAAQRASRAVYMHVDEVAALYKHISGRVDDVKQLNAHIKAERAYCIAKSAKKRKR